MAHIQRGDDRQYFAHELPGHEISQGIEAAGNSLFNAVNTGISIVQKANESALANNQIDLSTKFLAKNNEINTKYQADPANPEREEELKEAFDSLAAQYKVNPIVEPQWNEIKNNVYNGYKTYNAQWAQKQQQTNATVNLKEGYEKFINQASMLGMNGASVDEVKLIYESGISALKKGATPQLGEVTVGEALNTASQDYLASYLNGVIESNPAMAIEMLDRQDIQNDLRDANTINKLKQSARAKMLKQTELEAVDRAAGYITKNNDVFSKALDGTLTTIEAQEFLSDKNVDRNMRKILSDMLGYSSREDYWVDTESGELHSIKSDKAKEQMAEFADGNYQAYSTLTIGDKKWQFVTAKGKLRQPTPQEKEDIRNELYLRGSQLLNNVEGSSPQQSLRAIAQYQSQIAQASYFGLARSDYDKLMNDFVLPATENIQEDAKKYNANTSSWNPVSEKYGWEQIDKYFNKIQKDLGEKATKADKALITKEKSLASVYYWSALNNYCSQNGISMQQLQNMDRHQTAGLYKKAATDAIQKAKTTSQNPQLWFRAANPQYVSQIRNLLPDDNANDVITNVAVAVMSNPNMTDKDLGIIIYREVRNEYAKMRTSIQDRIDATYAKPHETKELTYYADSYLPQLGKEIGTKFTVVNGGRYRPSNGKYESYHTKGEAIDVSMSEHTNMTKEKFIKAQLSNPQVKKIGTSDPYILARFGSNSKIVDERNFDKKYGTNHVNHAHITLNVDKSQNKNVYKIGNYTVRVKG